MVTKNAAKSAPAAKPAATAEKPAEKAAPSRRPGIANVKEGLTFRGARQAWYETLQKYNGKPIADYEQACVEKPPSLPKSQRPEAPSGWVRYFLRVGALTITQPKA